MTRLSNSGVILSVLIVTYGSRDEISPCLDSIPGRLQGTGVKLKVLPCSLLDCLW